MKKSVSLYFAITVCVSFLTSCAFVSEKDLRKYSLEAKEKNPQVFIIYHDGDTLRGKTMKHKRNVINGKTSWTIDGKDIHPAHVKIYQDADGYRLKGFKRLIKGKMNLYYSQTDDSRLVSHYNSSTKSYSSSTTGGTHTTLYFGEGEEMKAATLNSLTEAMKNCPAAARQVEKEFANSFYSGPKRRDYVMNDYPKVIRILAIYNSGNCK